MPKQITSILIGFIYFVALYYLDFYVVPKLLPFPSDFCYYHSHNPPLWVDWFYLDTSGHIQPPFTGLHLILFLLFAMLATVLTTKKTIQFIFKSNNKK